MAQHESSAEDSMPRTRNGRSRGAVKVLRSRCDTRLVGFDAAHRVASRTNVAPVRSFDPAILCAAQEEVKVAAEDQKLGARS